MNSTLFAEDAILCADKVLALTAWDALVCADVRTTVRAEFVQRLGHALAAPENGTRKCT